MFVHLFQVVQQAVRHAVRPGAYDQPYDIGHSQRLFILPLQGLQLAISIGICLEVGKVFHFGVFMRKEDFPLLQLLRDRLSGAAIFGIESLVVAVSAAAIAFRAVAIGASESGVE